jgi:enoyl-CoA hydratase/carnithine racemase
MAITATLRDIMPADRVKQLAFSGRIIAGSEAELIGLVTSVHERPLDAAREFAKEIAGKSPDAIRAIKALVNDSWQDSVERSLQREARLQMSLLGKPNQTEAVTANLEKRTPDFQPAASSG